MGLYEGIKDVAKIVQQADNLELYRQLLDLSAQALDMQAAINKLTEENTALKKKQDLEKKIGELKDEYAMEKYAKHLNQVFNDEEEKDIHEHFPFRFFEESDDLLR